MGGHVALGSLRSGPSRIEHRHLVRIRASRSCSRDGRTTTPDGIAPAIVVESRDDILGQGRGEWCEYRCEVRPRGHGDDNMKIEPKIRGNICLTAHPDGCREQVREQIDFIQSQPAINGPKRVLVVGSSNGYGLAARITSAFSCGAATAGVFYERPGTETRTATVGWYNNVSFEEAARKSGLTAVSVNGDAFSNDVKNQTIQRIRDEMGPIDCVIYSIAAPRRIG